jgi:hypothetical protein
MAVGYRAGHAFRHCDPGAALYKSCERFSPAIHCACRKLRYFGIRPNDGYRRQLATIRCCLRCRCLRMVCRDVARRLQQRRHDRRRRLRLLAKNGRSGTQLSAMAAKFRRRARERKRNRRTRARTCSAIVCQHYSDRGNHASQADSSSVESSSHSSSSCVNSSASFACCA